MIVEEPPYDLVAVFADADTKMLFEGFIERGQERGCIRTIRWRSLRDPMRDALRADPMQVLRPFLSPNGPPALIVWDHQGSGAEGRPPEEVEQDVMMRMQQAGIQPAMIAAVAMRPEIEAALVPEWGRVKELVAQLRGQLPPTDTEIHEKASRAWNRRLGSFPEDVAEALESHPKEMFEALLWVLNLRFSASLFQDLGVRLSIPGTKANEEIRRALSALVSWFPPDDRQSAGA